MLSRILGFGLEIFGTMKNRQTNHHLEINVSDIYCLREDWAYALLDSFVLTPVLSPPPPHVTFKYNNTRQQNNFENLSSSTAAVPARPFWIVAGFCCYIQHCVMRAVRNRVPELNR